MDRRIIPLLSSHGGLSCTLDADAITDRVEEWRSVMKDAKRFEDISHGRRYVFERDTDVGEMARLAVAEQSCCSFFEFSIGVTSEAITLDITGPDAAREIIESFSDLPRI